MLGHLRQHWSDPPLPPLGAVEVFAGAPQYAARIVFGGDAVCKPAWPVSVLMSATRRKRGRVIELGKRVQRRGQIVKQATLDGLNQSTDHGGAVSAASQFCTS